MPQSLRYISFDSYIKPQLAQKSRKKLLSCISFDSYIKPQLCLVSRKLDACCISFDSYIKPQRLADVRPLRHGCISFDSYIKPQHCSNTPIVSNVVYLLIPTSNHNFTRHMSASSLLYIFWFLHQTTTVCRTIQVFIGCISFDSYIKPQPSLNILINLMVVYLLIPTSNHNLSLNMVLKLSLYIFWFLHQTTTLRL